MLHNNKIGGPDGVATGTRKGAWSWAAPLAFVPLALLIAIAGCTPAQQQAGPPQIHPPIQAPQPAASASTAALAAALPAPPSANDRPVVIPATMATPRPKLNGLDRAGVIEALGRPRLSRREAAAEVLTFGGLECSLFVFLYDGADGIGVVRHVEARARQGFALVSEGRCIDSVLGRKAAAGASPV